MPDRVDLRDTRGEDGIKHGISGKLREGMSARAAGKGEGKAMTGSGVVRPTAPPPKPADARASAKK